MFAKQNWFSNIFKGYEECLLGIFQCKFLCTLHILFIIWFHSLQIKYKSSISQPCLLNTGIIFSLSYSHNMHMMKLDFYSHL